MPDASDDEALLSSLGPEVAAIVQRLAAEPLLPPERLAVAVDGYLASVHAAHDGEPDVDLELAAAIAASAHRLIELIGPSTPERPRRLIQAAVRYFILEEDAEPDTGSVVGFDDDALVLNAVILHIGHDELLVPIP